MVLSNKLKPKWTEDDIKLQMSYFCTKRCAK